MNAILNILNNLDLSGKINAAGLLGMQSSDEGAQVDFSALLDNIAELNGGKNGLDENLIAQLNAIKSDLNNNQIDKSEFLNLLKSKTGVENIEVVSENNNIEPNQIISANPDKPILEKPAVEKEWTQVINPELVETVEIANIVPKQIDSNAPKSIDLETQTPKQLIPILASRPQNLKSDNVVVESQPIADEKNAKQISTLGFDNVEARPAEDAKNILKNETKGNLENVVVAENEKGATNKVNIEYLKPSDSKLNKSELELLEKSISVEPKTQPTTKNARFDRQYFDQTNNTDTEPSVKYNNQQTSKSDIVGLPEHSQRNVSKPTIAGEPKIDIAFDIDKPTPNSNGEVVSESELNALRKLSKDLKVSEYKVFNAGDSKQNRSAENVDTRPLFISKPVKITQVVSDNKPISESTANAKQPTEAKSSPLMVDPHIEDQPVHRIVSGDEKVNGETRILEPVEKKQSSALPAKNTTANIAAKSDSIALETNSKISGSTASSPNDTKLTRTARFELPEEIKFNQTAGKKTIQVKLMPETLGNLRITLTSDNRDMMHGRMIVENSQAMHTVESNMSSLIDSLSDKGIKLDSFDISLAGGSSERSFADGKSNGSNAKRNNGNDKVQKNNIESVRSTSDRTGYVGSSGVNLLI